MILRDTNPIEIKILLRKVSLLTIKELTTIWLINSGDGKHIMSGLYVNQTTQCIKSWNHRFNLAYAVHFAQPGFLVHGNLHCIYLTV